MNKNKQTSLLLNPIFAMILCAGMVVPSWAYAVEKADYQPATMRALTDHLFQEKMIDFDKPKQFAEYTIIEDCGLYQQYFNNDFQWNRIRVAIQEEMNSLKPRDGHTKLRIPGLVKIDRYNFTTQAFDINERYAFNKVGALLLSENRVEFCEGKFDLNDIKNLPSLYYLKPVAPFNLFRIPASKTIAKQVLDRTIPEDDGTRPIYVDINVTLDAFFGINRSSSRETSADILGNIDSIDFYTDEYHKNKFKTIYYEPY